jgi:cysteine-rich CPCC protein
VGYGGERYGWHCYIPGDTKRPTSAVTPAGAITKHLGYLPEEVPAWVREFSERRERELNEAPRYTCDCCGYKTLLSPGHYDICAVCSWEDDRADDNRRDGGPDALSGPNHISLSEARANFARYGACDEKGKEFARSPRPSEVPDKAAGDGV